MRFFFFVQIQLGYPVCFFIDYIFSYVHVCEGVGYVHRSARPIEARRGHWIALELKLQDMGVGH